jgi:CRISPR/Cas system-associated exonuclease Cas4 (RecB family)
MNFFPQDFQFSQHNLQDYVDCPRRFELRYLQKLKWPALQSEPVMEMEHRAELGRRFHEMVHQFHLGMPEDQISDQAKDVELASWWSEYLASPILMELPVYRKSEYLLTAPFSGYRLVAKYDLLAIDPGKKAVIIDWKTSGKPLPRKYLVDRLQTRVYPYLLVSAGQSLNGGQPFDPEQAELVYWFTSQPDQPVRIQYSEKLFRSDENYLQALVKDISTRPAGQFPLTLDEKKCAYCVYRSLCDRGKGAGNWQEDQEEDETQLDSSFPFDQIGEIEF